MQTISTPDGTATPIDNDILITAYDSTENDQDGITTRAGEDAGDPPDDGNGADNEVTIYLTNRITGNAETEDAATTETLIDFPLGATAGTYLFDVKIVGFNRTDNLSAGYQSYRTVRTTGGAATLVSANPGIISEEGAMTGVVVTNGISGNNATITVNGLAGKIIEWYALVNYIFIS